ncbi:SOS response-associated peptidase family protein [Lactobacillus sp. ESL0791]|uniref:SOS response-associated peptidase family protein n=1 Tax=Lactobacillus sp. ESL0791 TaxID=2983234 RepID=UPI0023F7F4C3|nr:SOS response-associated peptidase family protein [Lactobacillus sp. ESL0791]MDF7638289.1 SOS response-associated peptidase family protein [Lactobacillus sp. ESL0791]
MCNQFKIPSLAEIRHYLKSDLNLPLTVSRDTFPETKNIFPKQAAPILLYENEKLQLQSKNWGYPSPVDERKVLFNARIERFYEERPSMWDKSFAKQRCIIIASNFYEYGKKTYLAENGKKYHERFSFKIPDQPVTLIAGIYDQANFAMVTTKPNSTMTPIHDRMPLVIRPEELRQWLFQNFTALVDRSKVNLTVTKVAKN